MTYDAQFLRVWDRCWRKTGKGYAYKCWVKLDKDERDEVEKVLEQHRAYYGQKDLEYRPHLSTWLNQRRWEDELSDPLAAEKSIWDGYNAELDIGGWEYSRRMKLLQGGGQ